MMYMQDGIQMATIFGDGCHQGCFFNKLLGFGKRLLTGEGLFTTVFHNQGQEKRRVAFAAPYPGTIIPIDLSALGGTLLCQRDSFLCAARGPCSARERWGGSSAVTTNERRGPGNR